MAFNWICPHCGAAQTVTDGRIDVRDARVDVGKVFEGPLMARTSAIGCSNPNCNRITVSFSIHPVRYDGNFNAAVDEDKPVLYSRRAIPTSYAKPQPECIPIPLIEDYLEACLIRDDSPKASATLARRCIQGMIRDFCEIKKGTLAKEIEELNAQLQSGHAPAGVTHETVEAIDHVRSIGNIGAHMEKEIDLIVPVDPHEAQALIELIEMLFEEWYVARDTRQKKLAAISRIGGNKKQLVQDGRAARKALAAPDVSPEA